MRVTCTGRMTRPGRNHLERQCLYTRTSEALFLQFLPDPCLPPPTSRQRSQFVLCFDSSEGATMQSSLGLASCSQPNSPWPLLSFLQPPCVASMFTLVLTMHPQCGHPGDTRQGLTSLSERGKDEESRICLAVRTVRRAN